MLECPKSPVLESDHPAILDGEQVLNRWAGLAQNTQNSKFSLISVNYTEYVAKLAEICLFLHILSQNWREVYFRALQFNTMHWWEGIVQDKMVGRLEDSGARPKSSGRLPDDLKRLQESQGRRKNFHSDSRISWRVSKDLGCF